MIVKTIFQCNVSIYVYSYRKLIKVTPHAVRVVSLVLSSQKNGFQYHHQAFVLNPSVVGEKPVKVVSRGSISAV